MIIKEVKTSKIVNIIGSSQNVYNHIKNNVNSIKEHCNIFINKSGIYLKEHQKKDDFIIFQDVAAFFKLSPNFCNTNSNIVYIITKFTGFQLESTLKQNLYKLNSNFYKYDYVPNAYSVNSTFIPAIKFAVDVLKAEEIVFYGCDFTQRNVFDLKLGFKNEMHDTFKNDVLKQVEEIKKDNPNIKFIFQEIKNEI